MQVSFKRLAPTHNEWKLPFIIISLVSIDQPEFCSYNPASQGEPCLSETDINIRCIKSMVTFLRETCFSHLMVGIVIHILEVYNDVRLGLAEYA